jgi:hypothetical protein
MSKKPSHATVSLKTFVKEHMGLGKTNVFNFFQRIFYHLKILLDLRRGTEEEKFLEIDSASLCSLAGRYVKLGYRTGLPGLESIRGLL